MANNRGLFRIAVRGGVPRLRWWLKEPERSPRGGNDILGIVLLGLALLLFAALFSLTSTTSPTSGIRPSSHLTTGSASSAPGSVTTCSSRSADPAYLLPVLLLGFGLAQFLGFLGYLRRKWPWAVILALACAGALDLATDHRSWRS